MTYESEQDLSQYSGDGVTTDFPTGFGFLVNDDVRLLHTSAAGVDTLLVADVDYTLAGAGDEEGTATFPKSGSSFGVLGEGEKLTLYLDPEITQRRAFSNASVLPLVEVERGLDKLTMISRGIMARLKRAVMYPMSASESDVGTPESYIAEIKTHRQEAEDAASEALAAQTAAETAQGLAEDARDAAVASSITPLFTAAWDFVVGSGLGAAVKKTAAEVWAQFTSMVGAWTKQQYAPPVTVAPVAGAVTLDADLHQNCKITSTEALTMNAPTNAAEGKMLFVRLYAATALGITWDAVFVKNADKDLPTAHVAGKDMFHQFYYDGANWVLLGGCERA